MIGLAAGGWIDRVPIGLQMEITELINLTEAQHEIF